MVLMSEIATFGGSPMSVLSRHPGRSLSIGIGALALAALAVNGPVSAEESTVIPNDAAVVSETVTDMAPMVEPMEDVDESDLSAEAAGDMAPMVEPMEDVDESDLSAEADGDMAPMVEPMEDVDE